MRNTKDSGAMLRRIKVKPAFRRAMAVCAALCSVILVLVTLGRGAVGTPEAVASSITMEEALALGIQASSFQLPTGAYYSSSSPLEGKEESNRIPVGTYRVHLPDDYNPENPVTMQRTSGRIDAQTGGTSGTNCRSLTQDGETLYLGESYSQETLAEDGEVASTAYEYDEILVPADTLIYLEPILTDGTSPQTVLPGLTCFIDGQLFDEFRADKLSYELAYGPNLISQNPYEAEAQGDTQKHFSFEPVPEGWHMGDAIETKVWSVGSRTGISYTVILTNDVLTVPYSFSYEWATGYPGAVTLSETPDENKHMRVMTAAGTHTAVFEQAIPFMEARDATAIQRVSKEISEAVSQASEAIDQHDIVRLSMAMSTFTNAAETIKSVNTMWMPVEQASALNVVSGNFLSLVAQAETWMDEWATADDSPKQDEEPALSAQSEVGKDTVSEEASQGRIPANNQTPPESPKANTTSVAPQPETSTATDAPDSVDEAIVTVNYHVPDGTAGWTTGKTIRMRFGDGTKAEGYMGTLEDGAQFVGWFQKGTVSSLIQTGDDISKLFDGSSPTVDFYPAIEGVGDAMTVEIVSVTFKDGLTNKVIDKRSGVYTHADGVEIPARIVPPAAPEHQGYKFVGWDADTSAVTVKSSVSTALYSGSGKYGERRETVIVSQPRRREGVSKRLAQTGDAIAIVSVALLVASIIGLVVTRSAKTA